MYNIIRKAIMYSREGVWPRLEKQEHKHLLDIHKIYPELLEAVYFWEKTKYGKIPDQQFRKT